MLETFSRSYFLLFGIIVSAASFLFIEFIMPKVIKSLIAKGSVVQDYHKPEQPTIPRPGGPVILGGIVAGEIILLLLTRDARVIAILLTTIISFVVGLIDDKKVMPGWYKPVGLIFAGIPLVVLGAHGNHLNLIFGNVLIPVLYIPLVLIIIPIAGNTINSIDVMNGVASEVVIIALIPLLISIAVFGNTIIFLAALPLLFGMVAFYKYHRFPSKIFPGDSGTLLIGSMYGALAIAGSSEVIGVIALLPAVMNSFLFLDSVKKVIEHRQIKSRPTILMEDFRLMASKEGDAPSTLLRLILADGPLCEKEIGKRIFKLMIFSAVLAIVSIVLQYHFLTGITK